MSDPDIPASTGGGNGRRLLPPVLAIVGFAALVLAWTVGNPPWASPDEPTHEVRALAVAGGQLGGDRATAPPDGFPPATRDWVVRSSRVVDVPVLVAPPEDLFCDRFRPAVPATCLGAHPQPGPARRTTYVGTYQPYLYVAPGLAARAMGTPTAALYAGRLASAALSVALLSLAFAAVDWRRRPFGVAALLLAVTPMVAFLAASLSPNGPEIAAAIAFATLLLELTGSDRLGAWAWVGVAGSGAVLGAARSLGPAWVAGTVAIVAAVRRPAVMWTVVRARPRLLAGVTAVVISAVVAGAAWELRVQPHPPAATVTATVVMDQLRDLPRLLREQIGVFGWLDTSLARPLVTAWEAAMALLVVGALARGTGRSRIVLVLVVAGTVVGTIALGVDHRTTGFGLQGRYLLPATVLIPLTAGDIIDRSRRAVRARWSRWAPAGAAVGVAGIQVVAWLTNARRYAVGTHGRMLFLGHALWSPPGHWWPWAIVAAVGGCAIASAGVVAVAGHVAKVEPTDR